MQHDLQVPQALLELNGSHKPSFLGDMNFRLLNLRAAIKKGSTGDSRLFSDTARQMGLELDAWPASISPEFHYRTVCNAADDSYFGGTRHVYRDLWTVQLWNSWRTIRIQVNRIILEHKTCSGVPEWDESSQPRKIRESSTDICISVPELMGTPRKTWSLTPLVNENI
jgi:hypothetical protein